MKISKLLIVLFLAYGLFWHTADGQRRKKKTTGKPKSTATAPIQKNSSEATQSNYKIIVEGEQSKIETPFIFVARDAETYALMRSLVEGLPESSTIDFDKNAVVAAFAGTRNTGGWKVAIRRLDNKTKIELNSPPAGSMTTQMITYPFQVAAVPVDSIEALEIDAAATWTNQIKTFRVSKGSFEYTGGIAGKGKKFNAEGTIGVLNLGDHFTYLFALTGKDNGTKRALSEIASGVLKDGNIEFTRLDAGTFSEVPHPALKVSGTATDTKLVLKFDSLPPTIADGFLLKGSLEATRK